MTDAPAQVGYSWEKRKAWLDLPFPVNEYDSRVSNIRSKMRSAHLDAALILGDQNELGFLRYVTNFEPSLGRAVVLLPIEGEPLLVTDSIFHNEPLHSYLWMTWVKEVVACHPTIDDFTKNIIHSLKQRGLSDKNIGIVNRYSFPLLELEHALPQAIFTPFDSELSEIKSVKSPSEITLMKQVARITSKGMEAAVKAIQPGRTESEIVAEADFAMAKAGAHRHAFDTIVVAGPRAGLKHYYPTNRNLTEGDMVYLDMGASYHGYVSDMSRTVVIGSPSQRQKNALDVVLNIYSEMLRFGKPGVTAGELARFGIEKAEKADWGSSYFGVGHGLGTTLKDLPFINRLSETVLRENMVFALEPMIVEIGFGTAVIEDVLQVTSSGLVPLTEYERKLW
jgi:Xaa-Pro dipeptidase